MDSPCADSHSSTGSRHLFGPGKTLVQVYVGSTITGSTLLLSPDPPFFFHQIREIIFERCYDVLKCLQRFDGRLAVLQVLVITRFVPMYDSPLILSEILLVCPALKRMEVIGLDLDAAHEVGSPSDNTTSTRSKRIHRLIEFTPRRVYVDVGTLNTILSCCPYLVTFVVQDVRLLFTDINHRFGVFSEHSIQQQMRKLVQNTRLLCTRLKSIALTDLLMLRALAESLKATSQNLRTLDPSRSEFTPNSPVPITVCQLTLRCNSRDTCIRSQALDTQILTNYTLPLAATTGSRSRFFNFISHSVPAWSTSRSTGSSLCAWTNW